MEKTTKVLNIKRLPRDDRGNFARTFDAAGHRYTIRTQEEGIGIARYCKLLAMTSVWGFQADLGSQFNAWRAATDALDEAIRGKASFGKVYAVAQSAADGINRSSKVNYTYAFWAACLFVVRDGEDLTKFIEEEQKEKIDDWAREGYHEEDFEQLVKKKFREFSRESTPSAGPRPDDAMTTDPQ